MPAIRIYTDENVDPAIAEGLRRRGVYASCARQVGNLSLSDEDQLAYASGQHAVLFTHDPDLVALSSHWLIRGMHHWGIVYVHQDKLTIGQCVQRLKDLAEVLTPEEMRDRIEYL